jgi:soluble lytic murein transglycosylase-like protein
MRHFQIAGLLFLLCAPVYAQACWEQASQRYGVSAELLYAIARVESRGNPQAVNLSHRQRTGSYDIGLMQINSSNLRTLARYGIHERDLYQPCTSIHIGAWLLAHSFARHGATWEGVGAYNAACSQLKGAACQKARAKYAWLVYRQLPSQQASQKQTAPTRAADSRIAPQGTRPFAFSVRVSQ